MLITSTVVFLFEIIMLNYVNSLNIVRLGLHHKKQIIKLQKNKKTDKLLFILLKLNVVFGWTLNNTKNSYTIYCNNKINKQLITLVKPTKILYIKLKMLKKMFNTYNSNSVYLNTSKGIISIKNAIRNDVGGVLFFRLR